MKKKQKRARGAATIAPSRSSENMSVNRVDIADIYKKSLHNVCGLFLYITAGAKMDDTEISISRDAKGEALNEE